MQIWIQALRLQSVTALVRKMDHKRVQPRAWDCECGPMDERRAMSKHTYKERLEAGLAAYGFVRDAARSTSKYTAWTRGRPNDAYRFVGTSGAFRVGATATNSHSVGCPSNKTERYMALLAKGDAALTSQAKGAEYA